jgi:hypothetical protein
MGAARPLTASPRICNGISQVRLRGLLGRRPSRSGIPAAADDQGHKPVVLDLTAGVETIDVALYRIESEIDKAIATGAHKQPATPAAQVDPDTLFGES